MLEVIEVAKAFGGVQAISELSLRVDKGEIVSLIGPNGAGKTTLLNLISGFYRPDAGEIRLNGRPIGGLRPDRIVSAGIARTFQSLRLFDELSVLENVLVPQHHRLGIGWLRATLGTPRYRAQARAMKALAIEKLRFFGPRLMGYRLRQSVRSLSYANRRRVEMARAMATGAEVLLLDEPAAGMNPRETDEIGDIIVRMRDEGGYTLLVVEHKMNLVQKISDRVVAMDFGRKLAEGSYQQVASDPGVVESYLGRKRQEGRS